MGDCKVTDMGANMNSGPLQEQDALLIMESSLQFQNQSKRQDYGKLWFKKSI